MRPDKEFEKDVSNHVHNTEYSLADMITTDEEGGCIMKYLNASVQNATFGLIFGERHRSNHRQTKHTVITIQNIIHWRDATVRHQTKSAN